MAFRYAMSDIHGKYTLFKHALSHVDFTCKENQLFLLGDYIDRGEDGLSTLLHVQALQQESPTQVIALLGNHEALLIDDILSPQFSQSAYQRLFSLLTHEEYITLKNNTQEPMPTQADLVEFLRVHRKELLSWLVDLPYFYETQEQIFVHAGITHQEDWENASDEHMFLWDRSLPMGTFHKDIIMGHTPTPLVSGNPKFHGIFWDGASHFYIDGHAFHSHQLQLLRFDTVSKEYTFFCHDTQQFLPLKPYKELSPS